MTKTPHYDTLLALAATPIGKQACYVGSGMAKQAFFIPQLIRSLPKLSRGIRGAIKGGIDGAFGKGTAGRWKRNVTGAINGIGNAIGSAAKYVYNNPYSTIGWLGVPGLIAATGLTGIRGLVNLASDSGRPQQQYYGPGIPPYGWYGWRGQAGSGGYNGYRYNQNPDLSYYPEQQRPYQQPQQPRQNQGIMSQDAYWKSAEGINELNKWKTQHYNDYKRTQESYANNQKVMAELRRGAKYRLDSQRTPGFTSLSTSDSSTNANGLSALSLGNNYSFSNSTPQLQLDNKYSLSATPTGLNSMAL